MKMIEKLENKITEISLERNKYHATACQLKYNNEQMKKEIAKLKSDHAAALRKVKLNMLIVASVEICKMCGYKSPCIGTKLCEAMIKINAEAAKE